MLEVADALLERAIPKKGESINGTFVELVVRSAVLAFETATRPITIDPPPDGGRLALKPRPIDPPPDGG